MKTCTPLISVMQHLDENRRRKDKTIYDADKRTDGRQDRPFSHTLDKQAWLFRRGEPEILVGRGFPARGIHFLQHIYSKACRPDQLRNISS